MAVRNTPRFPRAGARGATGRASAGLPVETDLRNADAVRLKPRRGRRHCTRDSALSVGKSESRVTAKPRNPSNETRFPAFREGDDNVSALSSTRGGHDGQSR